MKGMNKSISNCNNPSRNLRVGDMAITTCRIDNMLGHIDRDTIVKIVGVSFAGYDIQDSHGNTVLFVDWDNLRPMTNSDE